MCGAAVAEVWLERARRFAGLAARALSEGDYDVACFFAQQSGELLLRGLLVREVGARPLGHSLLELARRLAAARGMELGEEVARCAKRLEEHYIQARYPDARVGPYQRWEGEECIKCLEALWTWTGGWR